MAWRRKRKWKFNKERAKAILWRVLWIVGMVVLVSVSACMVGSLAGFALAGPPGAIVGAIAGGLLGIGGGAMIGVSIGQQYKMPPKEEAPKKAVAAPPVQSVSAPQQEKTVEEVPSVLALKPQVEVSVAVEGESETHHIRYVGNSNTHEIHDIDHITGACMFNRILDKNKVEFDSWQDVEDAIQHKGYNGCHWCMEEYDTG